MFYTRMGSFLDSSNDKKGFNVSGFIFQHAWNYWNVNVTICYQDFLWLNEIFHVHILFMRTLFRLDR